MLHLEKKKKKTSVDIIMKISMIWSFYHPPPKNLKIKILKNENIYWRYHHFTNMCHKWKSYDVWFLRYEAWWTKFFVILDHFWPFTTLKTKNIKILKNWGKKPWTYYHFTYVYHKWQSYDVWLLRYGVWQTEFFVKPWKIKILKKWKKRPGDIIILIKFIKNHDHMLYCSWNMAFDGCIIVIFHFGLFFAVLSPNLPKNWTFKKKFRKNHWRYHHVAQVYQKSWSYMLYCSWGMVHDRCNCYFWFWAIFSPFTPLTAKKIEISKKWKTAEYIIILHIWTKNYDLMMYDS